ncbi:MAG: hypothetical protein ABSE70_05325 [Candidatus Limnocylindrales bacterium]
MSGGATSDPEPKKPDRICAWCSARAEADRIRCSQCGAELAQRETIDGLTISGVTVVDPALVGPETHRTIGTVWSERAGSVTIIGSQPETTSRPCDPATLGEPSEAARCVVRRLDGLATPEGSDKASPGHDS